MFTLKQDVRPHPELVDTEIDAEETVLLHLENKTYYSFNPTGIWQGSRTHPDVLGRVMTNIIRRIYEHLRFSWSFKSAVDSDPTKHPVL